MRVIASDTRNRMCATARDNDTRQQRTPNTKRHNNRQRGPPQLPSADDNGRTGTASHSFALQAAAVDAVAQVRQQFN